MTTRVTILLLVLAAPLGVRAAQIELLPTATVAGRFVRLGDVAHVHAADAETIRSFESAILAPAPAAEGRLLLDGTTIRARLRAVGLSIADVEFNGRARVVVTKAIPVVEPDPTTPRPAPAAPPETRPAVVADWQVQRAEEALVEGFHAQLRRQANITEKLKVELRFDRHEAGRLLEGRAAGFAFAGGRAPWNEFQTITVRFADRLGSVVEIPVRVRITPVAAVLVARRTLPRGAVVQRADLAWSRDDTAEQAFDDPRDLVGSETTRVVRAGLPIVADDVRSVPLVRRNDVITLVSRIAGITVKTYATAQRDGAAGQQITVVPLEDRRTLVAKVTGFHEAEVVTAPTPTADRSPHGALRPLERIPTDIESDIRFETTRKPVPPHRRAPITLTAAATRPVLLDTPRVERGHATTESVVRPAEHTTPLFAPPVSRPVPPRPSHPTDEIPDPWAAAEVDPKSR